MGNCSEFEQRILNLWKKGSKSYTYDEILSKLDCSNDDIGKLDEMIRDYSIIDVGDGKYKLRTKTSFKIGRYETFKNGDGKIYADDCEYSVYKGENLGIVHGDTVLFDSNVSKKSGKGVKIIKVIQRDLSYLLGEVVQYGKQFFLIPDDIRYNDLTVVLDGNDYVVGEKLRVFLAEKIQDNFYVGTVSIRLGHKDDPGVDVLMEAHRHEIYDKFGDDVQKEIMEIPSEVLDSEKIGRMDFTNKMIFSIDGVHTKDRDDAISLETLSEGRIRLGVHIADVSHYVKYDSALDKEARSRGTSSYLVGKVIPMLPHKLSNGICSLDEGVERLAISCLIELDIEGNVIRSDVVPSVIKSRKAMDYDSVNKILEEQIVPTGYEEFSDVLIIMNKLAILLAKKRELNGFVNFDSRELEVCCGNDGKINQFFIKSQKSAEQLIESFMILANETIAMKMRNYPFIYRVHDYYREEKMKGFLDMLKTIGISYTPHDDNIGKDLSIFLKGNGTLGSFLQTLLIRTFSKAIYDTENIGHYGLGLDVYCHFTSPIRRYPDLTVHRLVKKSLLSGFDVDICVDNNELSSIASYSSKKERNASECERSVLKMKCAEYMNKHIGEVFIGTIVSMSEKALYVELDNMVEGEISLRNLPGCYIYNKDLLAYISCDGGENYYLGDRLELVLKVANKERKLIGFSVNSKLFENCYIKTEEQKEHAKMLIKSAKNDKMYYNVSKGIKSNKRAKR